MLTVLLVLLAVLAVGGWLAFWMVQDQAKELLVERDSALDEAARLRRQTRSLLPGDTPIGDLAAAEVGLNVIPIGGAR